VEATIFLRALEHFILLLFFCPKEQAINISKHHYSSGAHMFMRKQNRHCNVTWTLLRRESIHDFILSPNQSTGSTWLRFQALDWIAHDFSRPCQLHHHLHCVSAGAAKTVNGWPATSLPPGMGDHTLEARYTLQPSYKC
jgi:hypothetical protein